MISINELLQVHKVVDEMFFEHQRALLHFQFDDALASLEAYETALLRHMQDEEEFLIPVYAECGKFPGAGAPKLFLDEHAKMRSYVEMFKERITALSSEPDTDRALLKLLDRESFYLRLCSHHDKREEDFLYPILDSTLSKAEKSLLLARMEMPEYRSLGPFVTA